MVCDFMSLQAPLAKNIAFTSGTFKSAGVLSCSDVDEQTLNDTAAIAYFNVGNHSLVHWL